MTIHTITASNGARCEIHADGAHITSWTPAGGEERLFISPLSAFGPGASIRGGVPVIFPQFSAWGPYARHGFARRVHWDYIGTAHLPEDRVQACFELRESPATLSEWPFAFRCVLSAALGRDRLEIELRVENPGTEQFSFSAALHTYFSVADLDRARLVGLQGAVYQDWAGGAAGQVRGLQQEEELAFAGKVDRIYTGAPAQLVLREPGRTLAIAQRGFNDTVVWNPGAEKGGALRDLEPGGWRGFVCVEAAVIDPAVTLLPGSVWSGAQILDANLQYYPPTLP